MMGTTSANIVKAVVKTRQDVGTLGKGTLNPHGNYKYVSIDRYYETVADAASKNGLMWVIREDEIAFTSATPKLSIQSKYTIDIYHESGEVIEGFSTLSIVHPVQGAQTVGSAMSYVDKVFMRQTFAVASGEKDIDADATDPGAFDLDPPKPAPRAAAKPPAPEKAKVVEVGPVPSYSGDLPGEEGNFDIVETFFMAFLPDVKSRAELNKFYLDPVNVNAMNHMKTHSPAQFKKVYDAFAERGKILGKLEEKESK
jgi:hypothetical protein